MDILGVIKGYHALVSVFLFIVHILQINDDGDDDDNDDVVLGLQ